MSLEHTETISDARLILEGHPALRRFGVPLVRTESEWERACAIALSPVHHYPWAQRRRIPVLEERQTRLYLSAMHERGESAAPRRDTHTYPRAVGLWRWPTVSIDWLPFAIAVLLAVPGFSLPYLWDDFDFLGRAMQFRASNFLPEQGTIFYRPVSRELYFGILAGLRATPALAHGLNLLCTLLLLYLLARVSRELAGRAAGTWSALIFACLGSLPMLSAWISGIQDLLAITFSLAALTAFIARRTPIGMVLYLLALLSKETAIAFLPALVLIAAKRAQSRRGMLLSMVGVCLVTATVFAIHPSWRFYLEHRGASAGGYLRLPGVDAIGTITSGVLAILNIPYSPPSTSAAQHLAPYLLAALVLLLVGYGIDRFSSRHAVPAGSARELATVGYSILGLGILAGSVLRHWAPYQAVLPAVGLAMVAGAVVPRLGVGYRWLILAGYLWLGVLARSMPMAPTVTTEPNLRASGAALSAIERGFKLLRPSFPSNSNILVSAQFGGPTAPYYQLYRFQPLRVWYWDASLFVLHPHGSRKGADRDLLFWITPAYQVFEIDLKTFRPRTTGPRPEPSSYQKALRRYAVGLAASGRVSEGVWILTNLNSSDPVLRVYDWRLAGALLIAAGKEAEASEVLRDLPMPPRETALDLIMTTLAESVPTLDLDDAVMRAFGISPRDAAANRSLMRGFERYRLMEASARFARRVLALTPSDRDAHRILRAAEAAGPSPQITVPVPHEGSSGPTPPLP